ncbi:MAG: hypothetical protein M1816_001809 [Peltula sp. TS41687]|nr:MAG: hypothetical protein M1816_001809 [Peltula sp. TS41687]
MPLVIITGYPCSGKTYRARQLLDFFNDKISGAQQQQQQQSADANHNNTTTKDAARIARLRLHHISDRTLGLRPDVYRDARPEKDARAAEFSAVERALGKDDIVVADGLNYIKGFRYQLYCAAKAVATPSCVIHVGTPIPRCRDINTRLLLAESSASDVTHTTNSGGGYPEDVFENLIYRYEEPNGMNRWDKPLFTVVWDDATPPLDDIWEALVGSSRTVKPNQATVLKPAAPSNHLYDLDLATQEVLARILAYQGDHPGEGGGEVRVDGVSAVIELPTAPLSVPLLQRLRRQFINLNRQHVPPQREGVNKERFVEYLNDSFDA